jgi:hypothetical protein
MAQFFGVIDFYGTAGIAKCLAFSKTAELNSLRLRVLSNSAKGLEFLGDFLCAISKFSAPLW